MTTLVTRPESGAGRTVAALRERGVEALSAPLFKIVPTGVPRPVGRFAALFVTSANGAEGLSPATADLPADLPVFAVGDRTAEAIRAAGFGNVTSAAGNARALARLASASLAPRYRLLLALGEDHKEALPAALTKAGFEVALWVRYKAHAVESLPEAAALALREGKVQAVLHYSRRASETLLTLADQAALADALAPVRHCCLSEDVAEPLRQRGLSHIAVAAQPDEADLLALVSAASMPTSPALALDGAEVATTTPPGIGAPPTAAIAAETMSGMGETSQGIGPARGTRRSRKAAQESTIAAITPTELPGDPEPRPAPGLSTAPAMPIQTDPETVSTITGAPGIDPDPSGVPGSLPAETASVAKIPDKEPEPAATVRPIDEPAVTPTVAEPAAPVPEPTPVRTERPMPVEDHAPPPPVTPAPPPSRGFGALGLGLAALLGGIAGAAAITFLAPVLNQAGIRFPNSPTLAETHARLTRLESAAPLAAQPAPAAAAPDLATALAPLTAEVATLRQQLAAAEQRVGELTARQAPAAPAPAPDLSPQIAELRQRLDGATRAAEAARAAATTAQALAPRLDEVERLARAERPASGPANAAARLVLGDRMRAALGEGRPFAAELTALTGLGIATEALRPLAAIASEGAPRLSALRAGLPPLRQSAQRHMASGASLGQRLLAMFDGVVRVRATGESDSGSPLALVDRIDQALERGDLAQATSLFQRLPEPVRRDGEAWSATLARRAGADQAIRAIMDDAVKALSAAN